MKHFISAVFITLFSIAATPQNAYAYCCWNEAICKAVCGQRCCGSGNFVSAQKQGRLSKIDADKLRREEQNARDCNAKIHNAFASELQKRRMPKAVKPKVRTPMMR